VVPASRETMTAIYVREVVHVRLEFDALRGTLLGNYQLTGDGRQAMPSYGGLWGLVRRSERDQEPVAGLGV